MQKKNYPADGEGNVQLEFLHLLVVWTVARQPAVAMSLNCGASNNNTWKQRGEECCLYQLSGVFLSKKCLLLL